MDLIFGNPIILQNILLGLDYDSIINYCRTHQYAGWICRDLLFWQQKALKDFGISAKVFNRSKLSPAQKYLYFLTASGGISINSYLFLKQDEFMKRAIQKGRQDIIDMLLAQGYNNWAVMANEYAKLGDIPMLNKYISNETYQKAAEGALESNNFKLFRNIVSIDPKRTYNISDLLTASAKGGNIEIFKYIQSLLGTIIIDYDKLFKTVIGLGHVSLARHITPGHIITNDDLVIMAFNRKHWKRFRELLNGPLDYQRIAKATTGNREIFKYVISSAPVGYQFDWTVLAADAIEVNDEQLLDDILTQHPNVLWHKLISNTVKFNRPIILNYILTLMPIGYNLSMLDWDLGAKTALQNGGKEVFDIVRRLAPVTHQWDWQELVIAAISFDDTNLLDYILSLSPPGYPWNIANIMLNSSEKMKAHIMSL